MRLYQARTSEHAYDQAVAVDRISGEFRVVDRMVASVPRASSPGTSSFFYNEQNRSRPRDDRRDEPSFSLIATQHPTQWRLFVQIEIGRVAVTREQVGRRGVHHELHRFTHLRRRTRPVDFE